MNKKSLLFEKLLKSMKMLLPRTSDTTVRYAFVVIGAVLVFADASNVYAHAGMNHETIAAITEHTAAYRTDAQNQIESARARPGARSASLTNEICVQKKEQLESAVNSISLLGIKKVATLDAIYLGVQNYYAQRAIKISGYDEAASKVSSAQSAALIDTSVLGVLNRPIQCSSAAGLTDVIAFRSGANIASSSIKMYEESLLALIDLVYSAQTGPDTSLQNGEGS